MVFMLFYAAPTGRTRHILLRADSFDEALKAGVQMFGDNLKKIVYSCSNQGFEKNFT